MPTIYAMGDSLTLDGEYESYLATLLGAGWTITNKGVSGDTVIQMAARFDDDVVAASPDYVIIWGGVNDLYQMESAATIETNLAAMYAAAAAANIKVIAVTFHSGKGVAEWSETKQTICDTVNTWIKGPAANVDWAIDAYAALEDPENADQLLPAYDSGDHIHLSDAGYDAVAAAIQAGVEDFLSDPEITYFGECNSAGVFNTPSGIDYLTDSYIWGCKTRTYTCPGTGPQNVSSLGAYMYELIPDRNFKIAVYDSSDNLIAECTIDTVLLEQVYAVLETTTITQYSPLTGGQAYKLEYLTTNAGFGLGYITVASGAMGYGAATTFASTLIALADYNEMPCLRCGVEAAGAGRTAFCMPFTP